MKITSKPEKGQRLIILIPTTLKRNLSKTMCIRVLKAQYMVLILTIQYPVREKI